jgi:hypothetical protein
MRSILEKAFVALLNEEHDKAEELFHKFIVERARQIHETNRAGEDYVLDENWQDEITTESYFTEDDLADLDDGEGEAAGEEDMAGMDGADEGDFGGDDMGGDEMGGEEGDMPADADAEMGDDMGGEEELSTDDKIDHLADEIEKLTAEFEAVMDAITDGSSDMDADAADMDADTADMDTDTADFGGDEADAEAVEDDMDGADEAPAMEGEEMDEDFDDITESIIDELEKVTVSLDDGHEIGKGGGFTQNRGAALPQKSKDARQGGAPIKMKRDDHKGFERETAPAVTTQKPVRNNVRTADAALSKVSKEGNKAAEINKLSSENGNTKSPLEGK